MAMYSYLLALVLLVASVHADSFSLDYDGGISVTLLHALDSAQPDHFTYRGNLTVNLKRGANAVQEPLSAVERQSLKTLAETDSFYRLKAIVTYNDGSTTSFLTFCKAVSGKRVYLSMIRTGKNLI